MIKKLRPVIILLSIAVVLVVAFFLLRDVFKILPSAEPGDDGEAITIYDFVGSTADSFSLTNSYGSYKLIKKVEKTFVIEGKEDLPISFDTVSTMLNAFGELSATKIVQEGVTDFSQYGFDEPLITAIMEKDGKTFKMEIGNMSSTESSYYMRVDDSDVLYLASSSTVNSFASSRYGFYSTVVCEFNSQTDSTNVTGFSLAGTAHPRTIVAQTNNLDEEEIGSAYQMIEPINHPFSTEMSNAIFDLINELNNVQVVSDDVSDESLESMGLLDPVNIFTYTVSDVDRVIYFGNKTEDGTSTYVMMKDGSLVHAISSEYTEVLEKDDAKYCEGSAYSRSYDTIDSMVISGMGKRYAIRITGTSEDNDLMAYINNKAVDYQNFADLFAHIITIDIKETGNMTDDAELLVEITVNLKEGGQEILQFYKINDLRCFYQLNGEGVFYVATSAVEQIIENAQKLYDGEEIVLEW